MPPQQPARAPGFTLIELLISLAIASFVVATTVHFFLNVKRTVQQEDLIKQVDANLRWGLNVLSDRLRNTGYGVPESNLAQWITWVSLSGNPEISQGATGNDPDTVRLAHCTSPPLTTLASASNSTLNPPQLALHTVSGLTANRVIVLDDREYLLVTAIDGNATPPTVTVDADPTSAGTQAPSRDYPQGTPVCRIDVFTFTVANNQLVVDRHDGNGAQAMLDGITNLQIIGATGSPDLRLTLSARSLAPLPGSGDYFTRSLSTDVRVRR